MKDPIYPVGNNEKKIRASANTFTLHPFNSLQTTKIWTSLLKAFADSNINVNQELKFALGKVENIVGKAENAGNQHFLLFPQSFQKALSTGSLKVWTVW